MLHWVALFTWIAAAALVLFDEASCADDEYFGKYISKLNSYHHQVSGDVYAVNKRTIFIKDFTYNGQGKDAFFWAGSTNIPGPQGFLVADEYNRTNLLKQYLSKDITLHLPKQKTLNDIKWLAIYDFTSQEPFGDVYIPDTFDAPSTQWLSRLSSKYHGVRSGDIRIIDAKTLEVTKFSYDGTGGDVYFWVGLGPQPSSKGTKVPDEHGYVDPLRRYSNEDVLLTLPGEWSIFEVRWLAVWNSVEEVSYGWTIIPRELNIPPSLVHVIPLQEEHDLFNCEQLHRDVQVLWSVHGGSMTFKLAAQIDEDEYVAFGFSGSQSKSQMIGADVVVAYLDGHLAHTVDYNISSHAPCHKVLGKYRGVCPDLTLGDIDNFQLLSKNRDKGVSSFAFRRDMNSRDPGDIVVSETDAVYIVWAVGRLDRQMKPSFHRLYSKHDVKLNFNKRSEENNCQAFTSQNSRHLKPWKKYSFSDPSLINITARLGPTGGQRGYTAITGETTSGLAWYLNGYLAPLIHLQRGKQYRFLVEGGNDPSDADFYHPFIITDEPVGGYGQLDEAARDDVRVLAGVSFTRRGQPQPTAAGRLCLWRHEQSLRVDRRLDDNFDNFKQYRNSLQLHCNEGRPASLLVTPNNSWPDTVWYHSYTRPHMGWRLRVVDKLTPISQAPPHFAPPSLLAISTMLLAFRNIV